MLCAFRVEPKVLGAIYGTAGLLQYYLYATWMALDIWRGIIYGIANKDPSRVSVVVPAQFASGYSSFIILSDL